MAIDAYNQSADSAFTERVLRGIDSAEQQRRRQARLRYLLPSSVIVVIVAAWATALPTGASVLRFLIEAVAWLRVVGEIEQHLSGALLGPFALLPSIVSSLLFLAAIFWVRMHQPGPPEWGP
ncbi:MAG TPA: hypothetical protein VNL16_05280 [Chloroflexota bacterium]|nr:hypothetical protein [Chloroflexota bacterium]